MQERIVQESVAGLGTQTLPWYMKSGSVSAPTTTTAPVTTSAPMTTTYQAAAPVTTTMSAYPQQQMRTQGHWQWEPQGVMTPPVAVTTSSRALTPPRAVPQTAATEYRPPRGHWEWWPEPQAQQVQSQVVMEQVQPVQQFATQQYTTQVQPQVQAQQFTTQAQPQVQVVEKPVYIDRVVEKPVYIDRPVHVPMPLPMQSMQVMDYAANQQAYAPNQQVRDAQPQDHHHIIERPVYMEVNRQREDAPDTVIRDVEVVERPVYIETPIPVPFERPVPVPVPHWQLMPQRKPVYEMMYGRPSDTPFPYHNPYPEIGCGFQERRLEASNEPDPIKAAMERFRMFG